MGEYAKNIQTVEDMWKKRIELRDGGGRMTELKPCPFCGGEAEAVHEINGMWTVECTKCGALVDGIAAWNTRAVEKWLTCKCGHEMESEGTCPMCGRWVHE